MRTQPPEEELRPVECAICQDQLASGALVPEQPPCPLFLSTLLCAFAQLQPRARLAQPQRLLALLQAAALRADPTHFTAAFSPRRFAQLRPRRC